MKPFDLKQDMSFALYGLSETDQKAFLEAVGPLTLEQKTSYQSYDEFVNRFEHSLELTDRARHMMGSYDRALMQVKRFFDDVQDVYVQGEDLVYDLGQQSSQTWFKGSALYVNFDEESLYDSDLFDAVQYACQYDEDIPLEELHLNYFRLGKLQAKLFAYFHERFGFEKYSSQVERLARLKEKNAVSDEDFLRDLENFSALEPHHLLPAMEAYYWRDLNWVDADTRREIVLSSFDESILVQREYKFHSCYHSSSWLRHVNLVEEAVIPLFPAGVFPFSPDELMETVALMILIESCGQEDVENGPYQGLLQIHRDRFEKYAPPSFHGENHTDAEVNIFTGVNYFIAHCLGKARNPAFSLTRALANYNMGSGAVGSYVSGSQSLSGESKDYLRDYLIYKRFLEEQEMGREKGE